MCCALMEFQFSMPIDPRQFLLVLYSITILKKQITSNNIVHIES